MPAMSLTISTSTETLADRLDRLGGISPARIPMVPPPGTAVEEDVLTKSAHGERRIYELVEGLLIEKTGDIRTAWMAGILQSRVHEFIERHDLGIAAGAGGPLRLAPGLVRVPDLSFVGWHQLPDRLLPAEPIPDLVPDLAVDFIRDTNTPQEMEQKRRDYFAAGSRLVWTIDRRSRSARSYTSLDSWSDVAETGALDGGSVLPGFEFPLSRWFNDASPLRARA
jgi:Uma2 family endonuclease